MKTLTIVVPCYNEEEALPFFYKEIKKYIDDLPVKVELLFINDGSKDGTLEILRNLSKEKHVNYLSFSRNFGKEAAMYAGLKEATGDYVVFMDADLQDPPKLLKEMVETQNINDIVSFKGFQKPVYPYMKEADIFLNTSESEGYPLTLCEALCLGLPIVATNITGSNEILMNSKAGILVEEEIVNIYNGLKRMIDNKSFRENCSENAVAFAKTFNVHETMQRIYNLI